MESENLSDSLGISDELIKKASSLSMEAHTYTSATRLFLLDWPHNTSDAIFAFSGSFSLEDWFAKRPFGDLKIDLGLFNSLRRIGFNDTALVNESFFRQFDTILRTSQFSDQVKKAVTEKRKIVFTGHSSGGPIAILATIWVLEQCMKLENNNNPILPLCVTFGSPLVGDRIFGHALRRENWSSHFIHFVARYDIVPRILLSPLSSIQRELQTILHFFNPKSKYFRSEYIATSWEVSEFFKTVMKNTLSVSSHAACSVMGCTNLLLESVTSSIEISPYRPFGTHVFFTINGGKLVIVKNPDAILQMLFYTLQLGPEEVAEIAYRSLHEHLIYDSHLRENLALKEFVFLDHSKKLPLSSADGNSQEMRLIHMALDDLGLSTRARLCLSAAQELEKQKLRNQEKIDSNRTKIKDAHEMLQKYRADTEVCEVGYYDAFKLQRSTDDFQVNVKRLELAGMWDEIVDMLKRYELPDGFEVRNEWVELGTMYRRLVEPLDIANYHRHLKNEDSGPYMIKGRPTRYKYMQRWLEHAHRVEAGSYLESCFWAEVEELCIDLNNNRAFEEVMVRVLELEGLVLKWISNRVLTRDIFLKDSTFVKWWMRLPLQHRERSQIASFMKGEGRNLQI